MFNLNAVWAALKAVWAARTTPKEAPEKEPSDSHDTVKATFVNWTATIVPFVLGLLLAISNGYFFAGFHDFNAADVGNLIAWGSGFAIEAATLAAVFNASLRLKSGDRKGFRSSLAVGLLLALISFTAQYVFLQMSLADGSLVVNESAVDKMPLFNLLIGVGGFQGHDVLFLIRASAYHIGEFACTFLFASTGISHEKKLEQQRKTFEYQMAEAQQTMVLDFMKSINENITSMIGAQQRLMAQQFVTVQESLEKPLPRIEGPITAEIDAKQIAQALEEQRNFRKAPWTPQPQPVSQQNQPGPVNE